MTRTLSLLILLGGFLTTEALAAPRSAPVTSEDDDFSLDDAPPPRAPAEPNRRRSNERAPEARGADASSARALLDRYANEPSVRDTQAAALAYAQIDADRFGSWRTRSRLAPLAPETTARLQRNLETDRTRGVLTSGTTDYTSTDDDTRYIVQGRWKLDELIFNQNELRVADRTIDVVRHRENVLDQVTKLYFERRRLQLEIDGAPGASSGPALRNFVRLQELTAALDALTGGWFGTQLEERRRAP